MIPPLCPSYFGSKIAEIQVWLTRKKSELDGKAKSSKFPALGGICEAVKFILWSDPMSRKLHDMKLHYTQRVIDVNKIDPFPHQRRRCFDADKLRELGESILLEGLLEPIVVLPIRKHYELILPENDHYGPSIIGNEKVPNFWQ